jgi:hypothetical protein
MDGEIWMVPGELLCSINEAGRNSRLVARRLLFPEKKPRIAPLPAIDIRSTNARILYREHALDYVDVEDRERLFCFHKLYTCIYHQMEVAGLSDDFTDADYLQWSLRIRDCILRHLDRPWFCLAMLGSKDGEMIPGSRDREKAAEELMFILRGLLAMMPQVLEIEASGRVPDKDSRFGSRGFFTWYHQWGSRLLGLAGQTGRLSQGQFDVYRATADGRDAVRLLQSWLGI